MRQRKHEERGKKTKIKNNSVYGYMADLTLFLKITKKWLCTQLEDHR